MARRSTVVKFGATLGGLVLMGLTACSETIPLPRPTELAAAPFKGGGAGSVELSWKLVVRVDGYRLHYDDDRSGAPYEGRGLSWVAWPVGCGDFDGSIGPTTRIAADFRLPDGGTRETGARDGGPRDAAAGDATAADAGARDAGRDAGRDSRPADGRSIDGAVPSSRLPGMPAPSPLVVPEAWCLERVPSYTDAGEVPSATPGTRPRLRLQGLVPGRTYYFAVQAFRRESQSELSDEVSFVPTPAK